MALVLMDMWIFMKEIGIFKNYKFITKTNKHIIVLISQFVYYHWFYQNQINS